MSIEAEKTEAKGGARDTVRVIIHALILALIVRVFLFQPFNIPSGSMIPTLLIGDYLFVSKYSYGYSRYSFPFGLDLFSGRVWAKEPERGDVVVFKLPRDNETDYIKRVIGLPSDRIQMRDGVLYINGEAVKKEYIGEYSNADGKAYYGHPTIPMYRETLPNGVSYRVLDVNPKGEADNTDEYVVPPGKYFMMGDNRDNSQDSRYSDVVGFVPYENFVGRADLIFFSIEPDVSLWEVWKWPFAIRWGRFFNVVN